MESHGAGELGLQVFQVGEVAVHEIIGNLAISFFHPEIQQDVGLEVILISLGGHFYFESPLQAF
jgi:hypothetical protein